MSNQLWAYLKEEFIGKDPNRVKIDEDIFRVIKETYCKKLNYVPLKPMALVIVNDPGSEIIKDISCSEPNDLLTNQFGLALAGILSSAGESNRTLVNNLGVSQSVNLNSVGFTYNRTSTVAPVTAPGVQTQLGQGTSTPQRTDIDIETPFTISPESLKLSIIAGGWFPASQQVIAKSLFQNAGANGNAGECALFGRWQNTSRIMNSFMLSHDLVTINWAKGQNVSVTYTWSIV